MYFSLKQKILYYTAFLLLLFSGLGWLYLHYFCTSQGDFGLETHPMEPKMLCLHGSVAMYCVFVFGSIWEIHVKRGLKLKSKKNRGTGITNAIILFVLIATGVMLYYTGDERVRLVASFIHWILGFLLFVVLMLHIFLIKIFKRKKRS